MPESNRFAHPVTVEADRLSYEPFKERGQVVRFSCGQSDLDESLDSTEVEEYERENLGRTTLAFYDGQLVGYYAISSDGLRLEYIQARKYPKSHVKKGKELVETVPSIKIGRLAVEQAHQCRGFGRLFIRRIAAIGLSGDSAVRLPIVNSKSTSVNFYLSCGFKLTREVGHERGRTERTMYLDLLGVEKEIFTSDRA
jgi:GNAT superfamily N-acetyltransferase